MYNIRLNQVTLAARNVAASVLFYQRLGLILIVDAAPRYVRFEFPEPPCGGEPATLSLHAVDDDWSPASEWPLVYFEVNDVAGFLNDAALTPLSKPELKSYAWEEADILDPSGNRLRIYKAGKARRFPGLAHRLTWTRFSTLGTRCRLATSTVCITGGVTGVTRTVRNGGRQGWIWAEELGGPSRISANFYRLASGPQLKPCEMPEHVVVDFVLGVRPAETEL